MKFGLLITFLGIFSLQLFAQPGGQEKPKIGIVSGKVVDAKSSAAVPYAKIFLLSQSIQRQSKQFLLTITFNILFFAINR